jgi:hypothetical protein
LYLGKGKNGHTNSVGILYTENFIRTTKQEKSSKLDAKINGQHIITEIIFFGILGPLVSAVHCTGSPVSIPTKLGYNFPSGFRED